MTPKVMTLRDDASRNLPFSSPFLTFLTYSSGIRCFATFVLRTFFPKKKHVVYLEDGLQLRHLPNNIPPSLPAAVLDMPEEIQECLLVAVECVLLRMGCA